MTPLVLDGSGNGTQEVAILTDGLSYVFGWTKSTPNGPTAGTLNLKSVWDQGYDYVTSPQTLAALETNLTGTDNDLRFVSKLPGTEGHSIQVEYVNTAVESQPLEFTVSGAIITVRSRLGTGTKQAATLTVLGLGVTGSGNLSCTFVSAKTGTIPFTVPVVAGDGPEAVGIKIRQRMDMIAAITSNFLLENPDEATDIVKMTARLPEANDGTLSLAYTIGTSTGLTNATSINVVTGALPVMLSTAAEVEAAIEANAAANALVTVTNKAANNGSGVITAMGAANLTGGVNQVTAREYPEAAFLDLDGAPISYDLGSADEGGFEFKNVAKGKLVVTVSGGTPNKVLFFNLTTSK